MVTGLILAEGASEEVAMTLAALVPAVVEGLMGDAVIVARQADSALKSIAEVAGANLVIAPLDTDPWRTGAIHARREWLLCLQSGEVPREGWMRAVERFLAIAPRRHQPLGRFSRRQAGHLFIDLVDRVTGTRSVRAGDLARRDWLTARQPARVRPMRIGAVIERDFAAR